MGTKMETLRRRPTLLYRLALAAVAIPIALVPIAYVGLIGLTGWGVYLFAIHCFIPIWEIPTLGNGYAVFVKIICSVTPLAAGTTIVIFMLKPLAARRAVGAQPLVLTERDEPRVHSLVAEVCRAVDAPAPRRIELSCEVNASAHRLGGWRGMFRDDLVLTLGLPLVVGLTKQELAGVIAHEFWHFRQGGATRTSFIIRSVDAWFQRAIYGRDRWDVALAKIGLWLRGFLSIVMIWSLFGLMIARGVLWVLMAIGRVFGAALSRQMEYDADRAAAFVAGSAAFESASVKLIVLSNISEELLLKMRRTWRTSHKLPDNLPLVIGARLEQMAPERRANLENTSNLARTNLFDSHPSTADRVQAARKLTQTGGDFGGGQADQLFDNFEGLSRLVTLAWYLDQFNVAATEDFLIPCSEWIETERAEARAKAARPKPRPVPRLG